MNISRHPVEKVPLLDLGPLHAALRKDIDQAIASVIDSNTFVQGEAVDRFEQKAARYLRVPHAIAVASGTDALLLALVAAGIGRDDEVITTAYTFFGTVEAILHTGATPVFADIDPESMTIDPKHVESLVSPKTRAILPVHLFGQPAHMKELLAIAGRRDLVVIEDAAQAFGARLGEQPVGSFGLAGCFSFHPSKPLGGIGDGGLITTREASFAEKLRALRNHGSQIRNRHAAVGFNSRLDSVQAAVLAVKLDHYPEHLAQRRQLAENYSRLLAGTALHLPATFPDRLHCFAQYTVRSPHRDRLHAALAVAGIDSAIHYPLPLYRQPAIAQRFSEGFELPVTETVCAQCLSLPLYPGLNERQQQRVGTVLATTLAAEKN